MATVKNTSRGVRTVQVFADKDRKKVDTIFLAPGEERDDINLVNEEDRVLQGMIEAGDLEISGSKKAAPKQEEPKK